MKRITFLLTLLAATLQLQAQTLVKGTLQDSLTHEGEPYATLRLYSGQDIKPGSQPVATALTDVDGHFKTRLGGKGLFTALLTSTGRKPVLRRFTAQGEQEIDLGILLTTDQDSMMQAMEVIAAKPIVKMEADKVTYSFEDDAESRTLTVLDMLRKVPMVSVDGQDNISVNGQASFKVYVDGKPNQMLSSNPSQILKAMPASMVSSIEVVTNPGAKYDAEGTGGILNLHMARMTAEQGGQSLNGFNGSLHAGGGNRNAGVGGQRAGQHGKLSYSANLEYAYVVNKDLDLQMLRTQEDGTRTEYSLRTRNEVPVILGNVGLGYEFSPLNQLNASFGIQRLSTTTKGTPTTTLSGGALMQPFTFRNRTRNYFAQTQYNASVDFTQYFDKGKEHSLTLIYQTSAAPSDKDTETTGFDQTNPLGNLNLTQERFSYGNENTLEHTVQADLTDKVAAHSRLNYGLKYSFRRGISDMNYFTSSGGDKVYDALNSVDYEHRNQIGAAYLESENSWEKWTAKAGLRYEHTWQEVRYHEGLGQDFRKDYGNLVPSATLSHTLKAGQNIGLTYNMRISRPGITYLNPYVDRSEPTSITYGNSDLEVEKSHAVGLTYSLYTQKFVLSTSLKETLANGGIEQYSFYDTDGLLNTTFGNIVDRRLTSLNVFAQWSVTKNTRLILNGSANHSYLTSDQLDITHKGWNGQGMLNLQQTFPHKWVAGLTVVGQTRTQTIQGHSTGYNLGVLTLSKTFLKDRLSLSAQGVTGLSRGGKLHIKQYAEGEGFTSSTDISVPVARFVLSVRWNFGNSSRQFKSHKADVQSDYIERKSQSEGISDAGKM